MSTIGANELVFYKDDEGDIYSGGFRVNSILMKQGFSPMMTLNGINSQMGGGSQMGGDSDNVGNVSDLFNDLVVPNWALAFPFKQSGGDYKQEKNANKKEEEHYKDDVLDEDIHTKLLSMLQPTSEMKKSSRKNKKKLFNKTKRIKLNQNKL